MKLKNVILCAVVTLMLMPTMVFAGGPKFSFSFNTFSSFFHHAPCPIPVPPPPAPPMPPVPVYPYAYPYAYPHYYPCPPPYISPGFGFSIAS